MDYERLMEKARQTNTQRDKDEHDIGFASPSDGDPSEFLRTAILAVRCGIETNDWSCIAEGQAMLEVLLKYLWWMESELKTISVNAGGCASFVTSLYTLGREMEDDLILGSDKVFWDNYVQNANSRYLMGTDEDETEAN